jgi:predicted RNA-binding Zn ribbon-like protein
MAEPNQASRYQVAAADGSLALVQDLLNTAALPHPRRESTDLLRDADSSAQWLADVGAEGETSHLASLRRLRDTIRHALIRRDEPDTADPTASPAGSISATLDLHLAPDGAVATTTQLTARVLLAIRDAQLTGTWRRLKVCRNPECRVAFWDQSRNTSAVWHDTRTCGNLTNTRNSRTRRRTTVPETS